MKPVTSSPCWEASVLPYAEREAWPGGPRVFLFTTPKGGKAILDGEGKEEQ